MSNFRHLIRHTATYSVAVVLSRIASFILLPVYTRYLNPSAYGLLEMLELVNFVFGALVGTHLSTGMTFFYSKADTEEDRLEASHTAIFGAHLIAVMVSGFGWFVAPFMSQWLFQTSQYTMHCRAMFLNVGLSLAQESGMSLLRVQNRSATYVSVLTARLMMLIGMNVTLLAVFHLGALAMLLGTTIATALVTLYLDFRNLWGVRWRFSFALLRQQFRYSYPLGMSAIGMTFVHSGDRFFLQRFATLSDVGLYGMAYRFGMLAGYVQAIFETYWTAQVFNIVKHESGEKYYVRTLTYYALTSSFAAVAVGLFSCPVVRLVTPSSFHDSALLIPLIAASYAWRSVGDYFRSAFAIERKTSRNIGVTLVGVILAAVTYSVLIPPFKATGAAVATALTFGGMNVIAYYAAQRVRRFEFEWRRLWTIGGCAALVMLPSVWLAHMHIAVQFLCAGALTALYPLLLWFAGIFEHEEVEAAVGFLRHGRQMLKARVAAV